MEITIRHNSFFMMRSLAVTKAIADQMESISIEQEKSGIAANKRIRKGIQHAKDCAEFISYLAMSIKLQGDKNGFIFKQIEMPTVKVNKEKIKLSKKDSERLGLEHFSSFEEDLMMSKTTIFEVRDTLKTLNLLRETNGRFARQVLFSLNFENVKKLYESVGDVFEYTLKIDSNYKQDKSDIDKFKGDVKSHQSQSDDYVEDDINVDNKYTNPVVDEITSEQLSKEFDLHCEGKLLIINNNTQLDTITGNVNNLNSSLSNLEVDNNGIILPSKNKVIGEKGIKRDQDRYDEIYAIDSDGDRLNSDDLLKSITMGKPTQISKVYYSIKSQKKAFGNNSSETEGPSIYKGQAGI